MNQGMSMAEHICETAEFLAGGVVCDACREAGVQDHICDAGCLEALATDLNGESL